MKKLFWLSLVMCLAFVYSGCSNNKQKEIDMLNKQVDSLLQDKENASEDDEFKDRMNQQLDEKDSIIQALQADLEKKNANNAQLQSKIKALTKSNTMLTEEKEKQNEALALQTEMDNEAYVLVGSRKTLSEMGVITGGLLMKTKVKYDSLNKSQFTKVDMRNFTELKIDSRNARILTQMPASSYRIEKNDSTSCTLYISDPAAFWSASHYLIIQTRPRYE